MGAKGVPPTSWTRDAPAQNSTETSAHELFSVLNTVATGVESRGSQPSTGKLADLHWLLAALRAGYGHC